MGQHWRSMGRGGVGQHGRGGGVDKPRAAVRLESSQEQQPCWGPAPVAPAVGPAPFSAVAARALPRSRLLPNSQLRLQGPLPRSQLLSHSHMRLPGPLLQLPGPLLRD